jgi:hypothetical protein
VPHPPTVLALLSVLFLYPHPHALAGEQSASRPSRVGSSNDPAPNWLHREGTNFVVHFLAGDEQLAEKVADAVERVRMELYRNWFAVPSPADWTSKCQVFMHSSVSTYALATENRASSSGYSVTHSTRGRIVSQRIDLLKDGSDLLHDVLPHELAHVLLSNYFVRRPLPLWAEEGLAVLAETPEIRNAHLRNLDMYARRGALFTTQEIMNMRDYPGGDQRGVFYAQSVSLVDYFISRRGTPQFMQFLSLATRQGSEPVLQRMYGVASVQQLHQDWIASSISVNKLGMSR